jgi:tetraacyldisaccharide 4'-kinase
MTQVPKRPRASIRTAVERIWRAPGSHPAVLLLRPFAALFGALVQARRVAYARGWRQAARVPVPVISIGNLTVGGAGKTPFTRWLASELLARGLRPAILHGGYSHDEPELHRTWHPAARVYASRDRVASSYSALEAGANVILLDDGRQHLRLSRDLDVVLVLADAWFRPQRLLPAGVWREPLATLATADVVVVTRKAAPAELAGALASELSKRFPGPVLATAHLALSGWSRLDTREPASAPGQAVLACGIAEPGALVEQLEMSGTRVLETIDFADHHIFSMSDLRLIAARAGARPIVITEKDAVKIARLDPGFQAFVVGQRVQIEQGLSGLRAAVERVLP